ncbi:MAG: hypothetical protein PHG36_03705 [Dehalococcoidia bacterium]|nr:hypothetical protein [Dehalococcoidia bacterium]
MWQSFEVPGGSSGTTQIENEKHQQLQLEEEIKQRVESKKTKKAKKAKEQKGQTPE